jgi:hypothetical protein
MTRERFNEIKNTFIHCHIEGLSDEFEELISAHESTINYNRFSADERLDFALWYSAMSQEFESNQWVDMWLKFREKQNDT